MSHGKGDQDTATDSANIVYCFPRQTKHYRRVYVVEGLVLMSVSWPDNWCPHIYTVVDNGLFRRTGVFHVNRGTGIIPLVELLRTMVSAMLKKAKLSVDSAIKH